MQVALHTGDFMVVCEGVVQVSTALPGRNKKTGDQKEGECPACHDLLCHAFRTVWVRIP